MPANVAASITTFRTSSMPKKPPMIDASLRKAVKASRMTHYALGKAAAVAPCVLDRWMLPADDPRHRKGMTLETAARIAAALNLVLVAVSDTE
jgi:hypothetical protein